ncbi:hypothetical protein K438DRAFT_1769793 [Mycena galopus ATCC 62051]|nr:hypothetical protein K438DRAFT_1769793 [Mycena galopus ATCC 62051]
MTPLYKFILNFSNTLMDWPTDPDIIVSAIKCAFPVLIQTEAVSTSLLDIWYGYTRVLALVPYGPPKWISVCIHESYKPVTVDPRFSLPKINPIIITGNLVTFKGHSTFTMPTDTLSCPERLLSQVIDPPPKAGGSSPKKAPLKRPAGDTDDKEPVKTESSLVGCMEVGHLRVEAVDMTVEKRKGMGGEMKERGFHVLIISGKKPQ